MTRTISKPPSILSLASNPCMQGMRGKYIDKNSPGHKDRPWQETQLVTNREWVSILSHYPGDKTHVTKHIRFCQILNPTQCTESWDGRHDDLLSVPAPCGDSMLGCKLSWQQRKVLKINVIFCLHHATIQEIKESLLSLVLEYILWWLQTKYKIYSFPNGLQLPNKLNWVRNAWGFQSSQDFNE